jgi:hypothetical protein
MGEKIPKGGRRTTTAAQAAAPYDKLAAFEIFHAERIQKYNTSRTIDTLII